MTGFKLGLLSQKNKLDSIYRLWSAYNKYAVTYLELGEQIQKSEKALSDMIDELTGNEFDMKGLEQFKTLLMGE